ncbi:MULTISPECIES: YeeE/YedE family protein [unclassified Pseudomonas]|uniref:YeeE/YedE family protein n=1 Tax=unclassified Pseudomonas TaxID=196821 RepID=UPI00244CA0CE|nr:MULTISPECIES: YeeE/YedE family protein [unclassified Pseudomonas]MDG9927584.1 YeeE/YedE family protein [Pseudomonas sp. GD04042]MDH0485333.1 YeeE/YedE family protein [Pseudomonas sp. GD04015]MDH0603815.1 YeeE/YedE family protein [Pseudomonas sp. GD03869]
MSTTSAPSPAPLALAVSLAVLVLLITGVWRLSGPDSESQALGLSLLGGALFGLLLQRSRFCFFCVTRDFLEQRRPDGLLGVLAALAVGSLGYHAVFGAFLPDPLGGRLPPDAHVGPLSWVLALAATLFGIGMAISGSCISAHLYRLGEGAFASLLALVGALIGFALGFMAWNPLYLASIQSAPVVWLPAWQGYGVSLLLQLAALGGLAVWLLRHRQPSEPARPVVRGLRQLLFGQRWPTWVGGVLIGFLGTLAYLRVAPLGVTAELGSLARTAADGLGLLPARMEGLDGFAGCATVVKQALLSNNGLFILGLVAASWASALVAGDFQPRRPTANELLRNLAGGVLLGLGSMLALGCTVGTLLSGVMAGALSGWLFGLFCLLGIWLGLVLRRAWP